MSTQVEKIATLRAEAARVRFDQSPFALRTVALSPDTLDALLDDLEASMEQPRPAAYLHEPCGTVATAEWVEQTNGGCTSCEWVTLEGWTVLVRDRDRDLADVVTPPEVPCTCHVRIGGGTHHPNCQVNLRSTPGAPS